MVEGVLYGRTIFNETLCVAFEASFENVLKEFTLQVGKLERMSVDQSAENYNNTGTHHVVTLVLLT